MKPERPDATQVGTKTGKVAQQLAKKRPSAQAKNEKADGSDRLDKSDDSGEAKAS